MNDDISTVDHFNTANDGKRTCGSIDDDADVDNDDGDDGDSALILVDCCAAAVLSAVHSWHLRLFGPLLNCVDEYCCFCSLFLHALHAYSDTDDVDNDDRIGDDADTDDDDDDNDDDDECMKDDTLSMSMSV
jgi:hypothetical protein